MWRHQKLAPFVLNKLRQNLNTLRWLVNAGACTGHVTRFLKNYDFTFTRPPYLIVPNWFENIPPDMSLRDWSVSIWESGLCFLVVVSPHTAAVPVTMSTLMYIRCDLTRYTMDLFTITYPYYIQANMSRFHEPIYTLFAVRKRTFQEVTPQT